MQGVMAEDTSSNTLCIGRVIHTLMTPGLITRTYMPQMHSQIFIFQTPLQLDNLQYKETIEIPKQFSSSLHSGYLHLLLLPQPQTTLSSILW